MTATRIVIGPDASGLARWYIALHDCKNQVVDVNVYGTSRSIVDSTVMPGASSKVSVQFRDRWVNRLTASLQHVCGSHGSGIVPLRWGTGDITTQGLNSDFYNVSDGTSATTTTAYPGPYQPSSAGGSSDYMTVRFTSATSIKFLTRGQAFDHLRAYCINGPSLNAWTLTIDGVSAGTCGGGSDSSNTAVIGISSAVRLAPHTASIVCVREPCAAYAMEVTAGTTGVSVNNFSVASASAEIFAYKPSIQYAFENVDPDSAALDIIEEGCNEPGQAFSATQFRITINNMLAHAYSAKSPASVLIMAEMQDSILGQAPFYRVELAAAAVENTGVVDLRTRWPNPPATMFGPDGIHESSLGNAVIFSQIIAPVLDDPMGVTSSFGVSERDSE